jgi:crotonobetainyl-CoA:carnitine CoA-transferase CaiB-like acyl-CoA transferase
MGRAELADDLMIRASKPPHCGSATNRYSTKSSLIGQTPCHVKAPAPLLGADTDAVLTSLLNLTTDQLERLRKAEVLL